MDTDGDGINDFIENGSIEYSLPNTNYTPETYKGDPLRKGLANGITGYLSLVACGDDDMKYSDGHIYFVYESFINDSIDFSDLSYGWSSIDMDKKWSWENIQEDIPVKSDYIIKKGESITFGNNIMYIGIESVINSISLYYHYSLTSDNKNTSEKNGASYNIEIYKSLSDNKDFIGYMNGYGLNAYITQSVTKEQLDKVISMCGNPYYDYWSIFNNCADVACVAWNNISTDEYKVDPNAITSVFNTPKGLKSYLLNNQDKYTVGESYNFLKEIVYFNCYEDEGYEYEDEYENT